MNTDNIKNPSTSLRLPFDFAQGRRSGQALMDQWNPQETAPQGNVFIANVGLPWAVFALWNEHEKEFVFAGFEKNTVNGLSDPFFGNEYINADELLGWLPLPECP